MQKKVNVQVQLMEKTDAMLIAREKERESPDISENGQRRGRRREIVSVAAL
jgi:hypothetical protein